MPFQIDFSGVGKALSTIAQSTIDRKVSELYSKALTSDNPEEITRILQEIARLSPEAGVAAAPVLEKRAKTLQVAEGLRDSFFAFLKESGASPEEIEVARNLFQSSPEAAIDLATKAYLGSLQTGLRTQKELEAQARFELGPLGEELTKVRSMRQIMHEVQRKKALYPLELQEVIDKEAIRLQNSLKQIEKKAEREQGLSFSDWFRIKTNAENTMIKFGDKVKELEDQRKELLDSPEIEKGNKQVELPEGGAISPIEALAILESPKKAQDILSRLDIPTTPANISAIKDIARDYLKDLSSSEKDNVRQYIEINKQLIATSKALENIISVANAANSALGMGSPYEPSMFTRSFGVPRIEEKPSSAAAGSLPTEIKAPKPPTSVLGKPLTPQEREAIEQGKGVFNILTEAAEKVKELIHPSPTPDILLRETIHEIKTKGTVPHPQVVINRLTEAFGRPLTEEELNQIRSAYQSRGIGLQ